MGFSFLWAGFIFNEAFDHKLVNVFVKSGLPWSWECGCADASSFKLKVSELLLNRAAAAAPQRVVACSPWYASFHFIAITKCNEFAPNKDGIALLTCRPPSH